MAKHENSNKGKSESGTCWNIHVTSGIRYKLFYVDLQSNFIKWQLTGCPVIIQRKIDGRDRRKDKKVACEL